ncbi:VCBS repeat-containing protein [Streptomyces lunalinharesii]|uniref:VCBS repeat-containing protein n=1 Tax=Streptomyces lunalinharesii TaxID=333384 RepID=A0ABP6FJI4_9ACTN
MTRSDISRPPRTSGRSARSRRLLTGAVALTLAVTAGPLVAPAVAATWAVTGAAASPAQQLKIAPGSEIVSAGRTGFLSVAADKTVSWTRYADGESRELATDDGTFTDSTLHGTASDVVALGDAPYVPSSKKITLRDMAAGTSTVIDLTPYGYAYAGTVGTSVIALKDTGKTREAHILENVGGKVTDRAVTGLRFPARDMAAVAGEPGAVVLRYEPDDVVGSLFSEYVVVDLASAKVTHHTLGADFSRVALSGTHVAVMGHENNNRDDMKLEVEKRGDNQQRTTHSPGRMYDPMVGLVGNWVLYGSKRKVHEGWAGFPQGLYAMPADGYVAHQVMDHATSVAPTPDGDLLVMGGTTGHGEGLYRVSIGAGAEPVAKLIASTGEPTKVTVLDSQVPAVAELDKGHWKARWRLSRPNVQEVTVTLRHTASGTERDVEIPLDHEVSASGKPTCIELDWDGLLGPSYGPDRAAPNGDYTWTLTAKPTNGIGPDLKERGTFTVARKPAPHDYTDNGSPDLLIRDGGDLTRSDTYRDPKNGRLKTREAEKIGWGWGVYDQVTAVGNVAGADHGDVVARDKAGVLWLYLGKGDGTFDGRVRIGAGWGDYTQLTGGGDVTGDGRGDLLARDSSGVLWLYKGTGSWKAPFAPRVKIGAGWNGYDRIVSVGDVAGGPAGDVVARDKAGVLWSYLGKGDGTFDGRVRIGAGWGAYSQMIGIGDANTDGKADLLVTSADGTSSVYHGTGNWKAPFAPREQTQLSVSSGQKLS